MTGTASDFGGLMLDVNSATLALDGLTRRDKSHATSGAVADARKVYLRLVDFQTTAWMTAIEARTVQTALDMLRSRLRFFGERV